MCLKCSAKCENNTPVCNAHGAYTDYNQCVTCDEMLPDSEMEEYCDACKTDYYAYSKMEEI